MVKRLIRRRSNGGGFGRPKSDVERRMSHYGISRSEAVRNAKKYPLPKRGSGRGRGR